MNIKVVINDVNRLTQTIAQLQSEIENLNEQITIKNTTITQLTAQVQTLNSEITTLENQITQLNSTIEAQSQTISTLQAQITDLDSQITNLNNQITSLNAQITSLNQQIASYDLQINQINGESVQDPLTYLATTKSLILSALQNKGSSATSSTTFRQYATEIENLPSGTPSSDTLALFHFDNDSGLTDSSDYERTLLTLTGTPQIDSTMGKFSNGSLYLDGSSALYINTTELNPFSYPEWTIEFWIQQKVSSLIWQTVLSQRKAYTPTGGSEIILYYRLNFDSGHQYKINFDYPNFVGNASGPTVAAQTSNYSVYLTDNWYHVALCKNSLDPSYLFRYYINGVFKSWNSTYSPAIGYRGFLPLPQLSTDVWIGARYNSAATPPCSDFFNGWLNDLRISKVCRYTENFTPPTEPFSS